MKRKRWLGISLAICMLAMSAFPVSASGYTDGSTDEDIKIVTYRDGVETYEDYSASTLSDPGDSDPIEPTSPRSEGIVSEEAMQNFEEAGLLDENGNFDWEAYAALPTLDEEPSGRSVIGTDDRYRVSDTSVSPYKYVAYLFVERDDGNYRGTGFVAGKGIVATCAHNFYNQETGWANEVTVILNRKDSVYPYGATVYTGLRTNNGWIETGEPAYDWGVIETQEDLSRYVGACGIKGTSYDLTGEPIELPGYPKVVQNSTNSHYMWTDTGIVTRIDSRDMVYYNADSSGGNSGSPVFWGSTAYACAIHSHGDLSNRENSGARIKGALYDMIMQYR